MTIDQEDKKGLSNLRMEKARQFFGDAEANLREGRLNTAVNRSYYAALNAVRSLLILKGANPGTHEGNVTMLSLRFVKPGLMSVDVVKSFKILLARRTDVDYGDFAAIDRAEAEDSLKISEEVIEKVDLLRKKMVSEM